MRKPPISFSKTVILSGLCVLMLVAVTPSFGLSKENNPGPPNIPILNNAPPQNIPDIFGTIGRWLKRLVGIKPKPIIEYRAGVVGLELDRTKVIQGCGSDANSSGSQQIKAIPEIDNQANGVLTFHYVVTGGRILDATPYSNEKGFYRFPIGSGTTAVWDLSGVSPGTYKITSGVDDGCGLCGKTVTKEVEVHPCP